jgi:signal transduction histidine kinase
MFLVLISIGAFAMFGFEQRHYSIALSIFGGVLFCVAYLFDFKIWQETYSNEYIFNNFLLNFFMSLFVSVSILYFLVDMNRYSEKSLEKKEAEAIEKNKELTKLNAELDRFVYSVSHDLRSPLSTISGLVNIGKHVENVEEAKKYFALIDGRLKTQDFFIREIIDFYRNSRTEINQEKFQLKEHVQQIVSEFSFSESPVSIRYDLEIADDLEIQTDKIRLRSVLSNLIGNAIKYHDQNKRERFVKVGAERENGHVNIFVEDNGLGIGEEHLAKVFDMFYRASADSKGSGLGLFIVKETVGKLGGKIGVDSRLGKGTKFSFTLSSESVVS